MAGGVGEVFFRAHRHGVHIGEQRGLASEGQDMVEKRMPLRCDKEPSPADLLDMEPSCDLALQRCMATVAIEFSGDGGVGGKEREEGKDGGEKLHLPGKRNAKSHFAVTLTV